MSDSSKPKTIELNVLKRDGSVQPFDKNKLLSSISKAGATQQQANLVSDKVINRVGGFKQPVPTSLISTMVARSLGQVNLKASGQYTTFCDEKLCSPLGPPAKGAALAKTPSALQSRARAQPATPVPVSEPTTPVTVDPTLFPNLSDASAVYGALFGLSQRARVSADPLSVSAEPLTASCEVGQSATFTAIASGGNPPYRYEWFEDTTFTRVGDSAAMSIRKGAGAYKFWCNVTDSTGATNSTKKVELRVVEHSNSDLPH